MVLVQPAAGKRHLTEMEMDYGNEQLMTVREASKLLRLSTGALWKDRTRATPHIPYVKLPTGSVRYKMSVIRQIVEGGSVGEAQHG